MEIVYFFGNTLYKPHKSSRFVFLFPSCRRKTFPPLTHSGAVLPLLQLRNRHALLALAVNAAAHALDTLVAAQMLLYGVAQHARALAVEPEVLLMDEPASALDPIATQRIEEGIHELKSQLSIVIVTHSMQQAARVSDRTAFFYMGKLIECDLTEKIFTNPSLKQTEDYITGRFG